MMRRARRLATLALLAAAPAWVQPAWVQPAWAQMDSREGIALQNQLLELRRDMQDLQSQRGGGGGLPPPTRIAPQSPSAGGGELTAQLLDRVARLEDDLRRLRGQMDELANQSRRQADELNKKVEDLTFRLQSEPGAEGRPPSPAPVPSGENRRVAPARRTPELAMQEGNAALARRDYPTAEAAAREVLAAGRSTPRAADGQFLLAQALAGKRDYQGAAVAYDDAYNRSRTGSRAPDALVGLANALAAINERPAACATLGKLRAEFPSPRADVREAADAARTRAGCR